MSEVFADPRVLSSSFFAFFQDYIQRIEKREIRELSGGIDIVTERNSNRALQAHGRPTE